MIMWYSTMQWFFCASVIVSASSERGCLVLFHLTVTLIVCACSVHPLPSQILTPRFNLQLPQWDDTLRQLPYSILGNAHLVLWVSLSLVLILRCPPRLLSFASVFFFTVPLSLWTRLHLVDVALGSSNWQKYIGNTGQHT